MTRWIIKAGLGLAVLLTATPSLAQGEYRVVKYLGATVRTFTATGEPNGKWDIGKLPPLPAKVVEEQDGHPGVRMGNDTIYLKQSDIVTEGAPSDCAELAINTKPNSARLAASEVGVSHGMSGSAVRCYHK